MPQDYHNYFSHGGIDNTYNSLPIGFSGESRMPGESDIKIIFRR